MPVRGGYYAATDVWKCFPILGNGVLVAGRRKQFERRGGFVVRHVESLSRDGAGLRRFLRVPHTIYRGDPHWVAPLGGEVRTVLSRENPFFEHAEGQLFVACRAGRDVGRIAAIIDHRHNELRGERTASFGFFDGRGLRPPDRGLRFIAVLHDDAQPALLPGPVRGSGPPQSKRPVGLPPRAHPGPRGAPGPPRRSRVAPNAGAGGPADPEA